MADIIKFGAWYSWLVSPISKEPTEEEMAQREAEYIASHPSTSVSVATSIASAATQAATAKREAKKAKDAAKAAQEAATAAARASEGAIGTGFDLKKYLWPIGLAVAAAGIFYYTTKAKS